MENKMEYYEKRDQEFLKEARYYCCDKTALLCIFWKVFLRPFGVK
jgi:hypothetical protein